MSKQNQKNTISNFMPCQFSGSNSSVHQRVFCRIQNLTHGSVLFSWLLVIAAAILTALWAASCIKLN
jgi:hypothetical protein